MYFNIVSAFLIAWVVLLLIPVVLVKIMKLRKPAVKYILVADVAVASAIASGRDIILFDEPTSGLDYRHMLRVSEVLRKLREKGKTVIIVTHDAELIKSACTYTLPFGTIKL